MAELLCAGERGGCRDGNRRQPRDGSNGDKVQPVRRAPGPCLRRWSEPDGVTLLRQLRILGIGRRRKGIKSAPAGPERFSDFYALRRKSKLCSRTGARHELRDGVALAVPNAKQHYFRSRRIFENVINA